jgi:hypothetical protein
VTGGRLDVVLLRDIPKYERLSMERFADELLEALGTQAAFRLRAFTVGRRL